MKISGVALCMVVLVAVVQISKVPVANAVTCSVSELSSCAGAITYGTPPSSTCCNKLKEQKPCLCGYLKDPNLKQFVSSPNARKVSSACGVAYPNC